MTDDRRKGLSRRDVLGAGGVAAVSAALGCAARPAGQAGAPAGAQAAAAGAAAAEIVLVNGRIHTMDRANTIASSVSMRDGRFAAVSDRALPGGQGTRVIDLKG